MKKNTILLLSLAGLSGLWTSCSTNSDPSATSAVGIKLSAATADGKTVIGGRTEAALTLTDVKVNLREIEFEYDHEDEHFKKDSTFKDDKETHLKGPFVVDLLDAGAFIDQVITTVDVPNASYEKISFKLAPGTTGDMAGKSILITGKIDTTQFIFWSDARDRFGVKFADSTSLSTSGAALELAIHMEMDKIFSKLNGGVDFTKLKDGNNDGIITIDPLNTDGNGDYVRYIIRLLLKRSYCKREGH
ncbi:MAG: hypothetical protein K1X47_01960 [Cyclobacteriaceae bacterium]|nr:hypothetical protein [Cyclobacteriaceae bacterium]